MLRSFLSGYYGKRLRNIMYIPTDSNLNQTEKSNKSTLHQILMRFGPYTLHVSDVNELFGRDQKSDTTRRTVKLTRSKLHTYDFFVCEKLPYDLKKRPASDYIYGTADPFYKSDERATYTAQRLSSIDARVVLLDVPEIDIMSSEYEAHDLNCRLPRKHRITDYVEKVLYGRLFKDFAVHWPGENLEPILRDFFFSKRVTQDSLESAIDTFLEGQSFNELERLTLIKKLMEQYYVHRLEDVAVNKRGYTGRGVIKTHDRAIKVDVADRLDREYLFYTLAADSEFAPFCPTLNVESGYTVFHNVGYLCISNLDTEPAGCRKANAIYQNALVRSREGLFNNHGIRYNLFLMGIFHKSFSTINSHHKAKMQLASYEDLSGNPHHLTADDPRQNDSGAAFKRFRDSAPHNEDSNKIIRDYSLLLEQLMKDDMLLFIDGDWKLDNIYRGHKVDFGTIGYGLEIDDLAYYLSDSALNLDRTAFRRFVKKYIDYRILHDIQFGDRLHDKDAESSFFTVADAAWLRQLVKRHAVMNKRDMMQDDKYLERQYYKHRIEEVLHDGTFV